MKFDSAPVTKSVQAPADHSADIIARQAAELRAMVVELARAERRERSRLAQVLHDHLQQILVAARMQLTVLQRQVSDARHNSAFRQIDALLEEGVEVSRNLAVELAPPILAEKGLAAALAWLGQQFHRRHGLTVHVEADPVADPQSGDLAEVLWGGVQELLFNVVKHAGVNEACVTMRPIGEQTVVIEVSDQGSGFAGEKGGALATAEGSGLLSLRQRLHALGGCFTIETSPGHGSTVLLTACRS